MPKIKVVIFNHDQRKTSEKLYRELRQEFDTALFDSGSSSTEVSPLSTHKFPNLYWTGCWNKAWELFGDSDLIWGIGGDCTLESKPGAYRHALQTAFPFGTWSPVVSGRSHEYMQPACAEQKIYSVLFLEGIAIALSRELWLLTGQLDPDNFIGHGLDLACCFSARQKGLKNILDGRVELSHPPSDKYDMDLAKDLMFASLERKFGKNWSDVLDWWWGRSISFKANAVSVIQLHGPEHTYIRPFYTK
jgi:hypothetical protein